MNNILIVDDHPLIREGLKKLFEKETDMSVVGELSNGLDVHNFIKEHEVDTVLLDISIPGKNGLDVLKDLKYAFPHIPVLILSIHSEERFAIRTLKAGAAGYITKEAAPNKLVYAIRKIDAGNKYISSNLAEKIADQLDYTSDKPRHESLSDREYQVMMMIAAGKKVAEIADDLNLSSRTIYSYRERIHEKMKMTTDAEIILYVIRNNLID